MTPPRLLIDGRALLDPTSGGVFEYADRVTSRLRSGTAFETTVWANRAKGAVPASVDRLTRWPNKALHACLLACGRPRLDHLADVPADLFWAPNPHFMALSSGTPYVLTIHDLSFERYPEFFSLKQRLWHRAIRVRERCVGAARLIAVSEHAKRELVDLYGLPPERIDAIHEGCDEAFFAPISSGRLASVRQQFSLPERFILHVGAMEPRKNHRSLIEAFERLATRPSLRDLGLVLAGPPGWRNRDVHEAIARSPFRDRIRLLGYVDADAKRALYRLASVFAFPSYYEGFGLPPLEAMASGTPVVASFAASLGEIVADGGLLIDPYRPAELADGLAAVLESPAFATALSARGAARARAFGWPACAEKTERTLLHALGR